MNKSVKKELSNVIYAMLPLREDCSMSIFSINVNQMLRNHAMDVDKYLY